MRFSRPANAFRVAYYPIGTQPARGMSSPRPQGNPLGRYGIPVPYARTMPYADIPAR